MPWNRLKSIYISKSVSQEMGMIVRRDSSNEKSIPKETKEVKKNLYLCPVMLVSLLKNDAI